MHRLRKHIAAWTGMIFGLFAIGLANANASSLPPDAASANVRHMADWVTASHDNKGAPFVIIDKMAAKVFVFGESGQLLGTAWALVGLAKGDDSAPGIGTMPLADITPDIRTTPAGRFVARLGHDLGTKDVLWVDYANAISLHRVINTNPAERRLERIVSQTPAEHRISYGCINVPAKFFDTIVDPLFKDSFGIVYILPEVKEMRAVFPNYVDGSEAATVTAAAPQPVTVQPVSVQNGVTQAAYQAGGAGGGSVEDHHLAGIVH